MGTNARCSSSSSSSSSFLQCMQLLLLVVVLMCNPSCAAAATSSHRGQRVVQLLRATLTNTKTESLCFLPAILPPLALHVIRRSENPQWAQRAPEIAISTARARHACRQEAGMCLVTRECHVTCVLCVDRGTKCDAAAVLRSLRARVPGIQD